MIALTPKQIGRVLSRAQTAPTERTIKVSLDERIDQELRRRLGNYSTSRRARAAYHDVVNAWVFERRKGRKPRQQGNLGKRVPA